MDMLIDFPDAVGGFYTGDATHINIQQHQIVAVRDPFGEKSLRAVKGVQFMDVRMGRVQLARQHLRQPVALGWKIVNDGDSHG